MIICRLLREQLSTINANDYTIHSSSIGMLTAEQAVQLKEAGLTAYNHNLGNDDDDDDDDDDGSDDQDQDQGDDLHSPQHHYFISTSSPILFSCHLASNNRHFTRVLSLHHHHEVLR